MRPRPGAVLPVSVAAVVVAVVMVVPVAIVVPMAVVMPMAKVGRIAIAVIGTIAIMVAMAQGRPEKQSAHDSEREAASMPAVMVASPPVRFRLRRKH